MKFTQKWMVVPFEKDYEFRHKNSHQILKNKILPNDVKSKLFNQMLTKFLLKKNPESQLPTEFNKEAVENEETKIIENDYKQMVKEIENNYKTEPKINFFRQIDKKPNEDEEMMDVEIDDQTIVQAKKKPRAAKRNLDMSLNQSIRSTKQNKKEKLKEYYNEALLEDAPSQNTRNQKIKYKLNTAQLGNGWLKYK